VAAGAVRTAGGGLPMVRTAGESVPVQHRGWNCPPVQPRWVIANWGPLAWLVGAHKFDSGPMPLGVCPTMCRALLMGRLAFGPPLPVEIFRCRAGPNALLRAMPNNEKATPFFVSCNSVGAWSAPAKMCQPASNPKPTPYQFLSFDSAGTFTCFLFYCQTQKKPPTSTRCLMEVMGLHPCRFRRPSFRRTRRCANALTAGRLRSRAARPSPVWAADYPCLCPASVDEKGPSFQYICAITFVALLPPGLRPSHDAFGWRDGALFPAIPINLGIRFQRLSARWVPLAHAIYRWQCGPDVNRFFRWPAGIAFRIFAENWFGNPATLQADSRL